MDLVCFACLHLEKLRLQHCSQNASFKNIVEAHYVVEHLK